MINSKIRYINIINSKNIRFLKKKIFHLHKIRKYCFPFIFFFEIEKLFEKSETMATTNFVKILKNPFHLVLN